MLPVDGQASYPRPAPQLYGELSPEVRAAMEASLNRLVTVTRGSGYSALFRGLRKAKALGKWATCAGLDRVLGGQSTLIANEAAVHRAIWRMDREAGEGVPLPPDAESHVRWESTVY